MVHPNTPICYYPCPNFSKLKVATICILFLSFLASAHGQDLECCDCSSATQITCGERISGHTAEGQARNHNYRCMDQELDAFDAPELIYQLPDQPGLIFDLEIHLVDLDEVGLDLFLIRNCGSELSACVAFKERTGESPKEDFLMVTGLVASADYYLIIDARSATGGFNVEIDCRDATLLCENAIELSCGDSAFGEIDEDNSIYDGYTCFDDGLTGFRSSEVIYRLVEVPADATSLMIELEDSDDQGLDIFVVENCGSDFLNCLAYKERTSSDPQIDLLQVSGIGAENEYFIIIDAKSARGQFQISVRCLIGDLKCGLADGQIFCGETRSFSTEATDNKFVDDFYKNLGLAGPCFPDFCCEYGHSDLVLEFSLDEPKRVGLDLQRTDEFEDTLGVFLFTGLCTENPELLSFKESDRSDFQLEPTTLPPGDYEILIDRKCVGFLGPIPFSLTATLECFQINTVCDLGGQFIDRGNVISGVLDENDLAPPDLEFIFCSDQVIEFSKPAYADVFTYFNKDIGDNLSINLNADSDEARVFIFSCNCDELDLCEAVCVGADDQGSIELDSVLEPFYFLVVISSERGPYELRMTPSGPCTNSDPRPLSCSDVISDLDLDFDGSQQYNTLESDENIYTNCRNLSSDRTYEGGDIVFALQIEDPRKVTFTLESQSGLGMFLFNQDCGRTCMRAAETPDQGGTAVLDTIPLFTGLYYLVIDKASSDGDGTFELSVDCSQEIDFSTFYLMDDCPVILNQVHSVTVQDLDNKSQVNGRSLTPRDRIGFYYRDGEFEIPEGPAEAWNNDVIQFSLEQDDENLDNIKCSFEPGEDFVIKVTRDEDGIDRTFKVIADFDTIGSNNVNALNQFVAGGISAINRLTDDATVLASYLATDINYKEVSMTFDTVEIRVISNIDWEVKSDADWIKAGSFSGTKSDTFTVRTEENTTRKDRSGKVFVIGSNGTLRTIFLEQPFDSSVSYNLENLEALIEIYPNPTAEHLHVTSETEFLLLGLYDVMGKRLLRTIAEKRNEVVLDLGSLKPGIYLLKMALKNQVFSKKILRY